MKRLSVFVPAIVLAALVLNSFILKEEEAASKTSGETESVAGVKAGGKSLVPAKVNRDKRALANIVFKSVDGGQTWQDISEGLPENLMEEGVQRTSYFASERGLYLRAGNTIYHSEPDSRAAGWRKEVLPSKQGSISPGKAGIFAYNYDGHFLQKSEAMGKWAPVYENFEGGEVRSIFETAGGTIFIGANNRLLKSTDAGKTWKAPPTGGLVMKMVESNGVLLAAGLHGILRSTDDGESWKWVIREGGIGVGLEQIKGGFAAITYNKESNSRRVRTSHDGGKTWQAIDAGLQADVKFHFARTLFYDRPRPQAFITSIVEAGEYFYCGHPAGIYRSSDKGRTWKLIRPSVDNKVFDLSVSGKVIYAIPTATGC